MKVSSISRRAMLAVGGVCAGWPMTALGVTNAAGPEASKESDPLKILDMALRLTVEVRINDTGPYPFIVDTGANASVVSSELAAAIGLRRGAAVQIHGIAGAGMADTTVAEVFQVGRRRRAGMVLTIVPERRLGCAGLIGLDWLGVQSLFLDYGRQRMAVDRALPRDDSRTGVAPARTQRNGITLIDAIVPGMGLPAFVDSGATNTVGNRAFYEAGRRSGAIGAGAIDLTLQSVTGQGMPGRLAAVKALIIGGFLLRDVPVVFGPIHTFDFWGMSDKPAMLIGADVLQRFDTIAMDFKHGEFRFRMAGQG
jgi:predicted aspartyl protease